MLVRSDRMVSSYNWLVMLPFQLSFEKKIRTTNIGKGWSNRNHEKISGQNQTLFEKEIFEKYCPTQFVKTFFKRDFMTV